MLKTIQSEFQNDLFGNEIQRNTFPRTQYLGSKERLVDWIFEKSPRGINTVFDAFSGSSVVGYKFKCKGKQIFGNDFLKFNFHIGRALIENSLETLSTEDVQLLLKKNDRSETLIEDVFTDVFFERDQAVFLDQFRANINDLSNVSKKSLAMTIMCRALTRKVLLGHFAHLSFVYQNRA